MRALVKKPGETATRIDLPEQPDPQIEAMWAAIGGYVEIAVRGRDFVVWCHDEGKLRGLPLNFHRPQDLDAIVGTVIVTGAIRMTLDGGVPSELADDVAIRVAALLDAWASAGKLCGTLAEHYDPLTADEWTSARERAEIKHRAAVEILGAEMVRRGLHGRDA